MRCPHSVASRIYFLVLRQAAQLPFCQPLPSQSSVDAFKACGFKDGTSTCLELLDRLFQACQSNLTGRSIVLRRTSSVTASHALCKCSASDALPRDLPSRADQEADLYIRWRQEGTRRTTPLQPEFARHNGLRNRHKQARKRYGRHTAWRPHRAHACEILRKVSFLKKDEKGMLTSRRLSLQSSSLTQVPNSRLPRHSVGFNEPYFDKKAMSVLGLLELNLVTPHKTMLTLRSCATLSSSKV